MIIMYYQTLSYSLGKNSPVHIGLKKPVIKPNYQIDLGDGYNTSIITIENHSGTHIDAPGHFIEGAKKIMEYSTDDLIFKNPIIIEVIKDGRELINISDIQNQNLKDYDCILFKTGFCRFREEDVDKYLTSNPGISPEAIAYIREEFHNIRCLGIDSISISPYGDSELAIKSHITAFKDGTSFGEPLLLIEDLDLNNISSQNKIKKIIVCPWQLEDVDSAPCSVIAEII
ncbi:MAG: cyclase family protein [Methanobacteriaceae archaeon]|nr:cyclase family protein [Methanobacteriaceae archaeon]